MATAKGKTRRPGLASCRVGLFVEGTSELTPDRRADLAELWRYLCDRLGATSNRQVLGVHGFTKQQLVLMASPAAVTVAPRIPLDALVARQHDETPFDRIVVAFDALPANQEVLDLPGGSCLASERDFLLKKFSESAVLDRRFKASAGSLLRHYRSHRGQPRVRTRPPLGDVEVIYMAPMFEALVMTDAAAIRKVFGLERVPRNWPKIPFRGPRPDFAFAKIVDDHRGDGPTYLRQPYKERKHAWAQEVMRKAGPESPLLAHVIARRLAELVR